MPDRRTSTMFLTHVQNQKRATDMNADKTVYLVENDESVQDSISETLSSNGYSVRTFSTADSFNEKYEAAPGCILIDVRLPDKSGVEVFEALTERGNRNPVRHDLRLRRCSSRSEVSQDGRTRFSVQAAEASTIAECCRVGVSTKWCHLAM